MRSAGTGWSPVAVCLAALVLGVLPPQAARAAELDGTVFLATGATDRDSVETDTLDQQYNLNLLQPLTEYLKLRMGYRLFDFTSDTAGTEIGRRTSEPQVELTYSHPRVFGSLTYLDRSTSGLAGGGDFDTESLLGHVTWRPLDSTHISLRYRDERNATDVEGIFGRGTDSRFLDLETAYQQRHWGTAYSYERREVENTGTGLRFVEDRQEVRLNANRAFFDDRLSLSFDSELDYRDRREETPGSGPIAAPIPATDGLSAIDPSPETGELESTPALVDGDFENPVQPEIEIGGAFTFRNLGVDLGFTQPVTRMEVTVDALSGPGLAWEVYHSRDNLLWEPVAGAVSRWDPALLRYTIRFPQTTDRYFKVVNVGVNSETGVRVTELRALVDVEEGTLRTEGDSTLVRADAAARYRPHERVTTSVSLGVREDEGVAAGTLRREFSDVHGAARASVDLPGHLQLRGGYRYVDFENRVEPVVARTEETATGSLTWSPLRTLSATASHVQRDESDEEALIRSTATTRLAVDSELLPGLRLDSIVEWSQVEDPFFGLDRDVFTWREMIDARPFRTLRVAGGYQYLEYTTAAGETLLERSSLELRTTWTPTPWVTLDGNWRYEDEDDRDSLRQSYNLTYSPGTKLTLSGFYQEFEDANLRETTASSLSANYRLNPRFRLFGNLTRSETRDLAGEGTEITSLRTGLSFFF